MGGNGSFVSEQELAQLLKIGASNEAFVTRAHQIITGYLAMKAGEHQESELSPADLAYLSSKIEKVWFDEYEYATMPLKGAAVVQLSVTDKARDLVVDLANQMAIGEHADITGHVITRDDTYAVWSCYTLGNWKVLVSTIVDNGMYYEVTHNGLKSTTYIDAYRKVRNIEVPDDA